jgi:hypothetical protein
VSVVINRMDSAKLGYCNAGLRQFFAFHNLDWQTFLRQGLPEAAFAACSTDPMYVRLLEAAKARCGQG